MDSNDLLNDLVRALGELEDALLLPAENDVIKAGCIQYFEFTFELAWKTVKRFAEDEGISDCNSPKAALKAAFACGWINEEEVWLDMLSSRNKMSHTYSASSALQIFDKLPRYANVLKKLTTRFSDMKGI
jgi:nucleotidyltransferase substrate binding protein (TIGR01987 family)